MRYNRRMNAFKPRLAAVSVTVAISALLAGFGLAHSYTPAPAVRTVTLPDLPDGTGTRLPNGWRLTPAGTHIPLPGDLPLKMLFSPDGKYLLVNTGGYHNHSVSVVDPQTGTVVSSVDVDKDWAGLCFDPSGHTVYVAAGQGLTAEELADVVKGGATARRIASMQESVQRLGYANGMLTPQPALPVPFLAGKERWTGGLAAGRDGSLYLAEVEGDTIYKLAGSPAAVQAQAKVGYHPYTVVLSPDGRTLAVSNWGAESVSLLNASDLKETARIDVGSHPNEMVWAKDGRLFVANAGSNSVSIIKNGVVTETVKTSLSPTDLVGSTPDALAVSPDGRRLYVANADNNDVAVVDISNAKEARVLGFIPTGWYPSALALAPDGRTLYVGTGKGLGFRGNPAATLADPNSTRTEPVINHKYDYIGGILSGDVSAVRLPDARGLAAYTRQVVANVPDPPVPIADGSLPVNLGIGLFALHKIKHVLYIIRENRTYDQEFGDIRRGNGDSSLTIFGQSVTPNAHALAANYVLLDNLYCNGEVSEDGHQWCDAAYATDFTEKVWPSAYSDRAEPDADERLTASPAGYLWDLCAKHNLTYYSYGESSSFKSSPNAPPIFTGARGLNGHASAAWSALSFDRHDTEHSAMFLADLHTAEKTGVWPSFTVMWLGEDHTQGLEAGKYTPVAHVAANDQALGQIVEGVSHSRFWKDTAIFVIEDDAQNGPDHVDAHRTVGLVISPYVKRGATDSTPYTTASMVRTMELILNLPPMTQYDENATLMLNCFTPAADMTVYTNIGPKVDMEAKNPGKGPGAVASAKLDLSAPDRADPDALNAILWHALKPGVKMPAPVRSARLARK